MSEFVKSIKMRISRAIFDLFYPVFEQKFVKI